jgi:hypothetical protein
MDIVSMKMPFQCPSTLSKWLCFQQDQEGVDSPKGRRQLNRTKLRALVFGDKTGAGT